MDQYPFYSGHPSQQHSFSAYGQPTANQNSQSDGLQGSFDPLNYQPFDQAYHPTGQPFNPPPQSPPDSYSVSGSSEPHSAGHYPTSIEARDDIFNLMRSSSEEKDREGLMTPAQSKRKAQNRAAQRAFRERKERHVRDLEEKVSNLQQESSTLLADNERLKRELARYSTENEILRATNTSTGSLNHNSEQPTETGPMTYSPTDFYSNIVPEGQSARLHRVAYCKETGEKLLDAGAAWDVIQGHELFRRGLLDLAGVTKRLKLVAQCDGQGPAFRESHVWKAIEESAVEDCDELL